MKLIINTNPRSDNQSVNITLARTLADCLEGPVQVIRLYDAEQKYFNYHFNQEWVKLLIQAKYLIFPVPMWNFSIPAALKDFFDKVIKKGEVWDLDKNNKFVGLLSDRPAFIIMTSGDFYPSGHSQDFVIPYIKTILNAIGIKNVKDFRVGGVRGDAKLLADKKFMETTTKAMLKTFGVTKAKSKPHP